MSRSLGFQTMLKRGFNCNGGYPCKTSQSVDITEATQKFTTTITPQQSDNPEISRDDETDVLCILRPTSAEAGRTVILVAETAPQHILQNIVMSQIYTGQNSSVVQNRSRDRAPCPRTGVMDRSHINSTTEQNNPSYGHPSDIALRLSSKLKDPHRGFVFGRLQSRCDIIMPSKAETNISGVHFRIFVNEEGLTMLENISRNGTLVDGHFLTAKSKDPGARSTRMIIRGSLIEVFCDQRQKSIRFVIGVPERRYLQDKWEQKLADYVNYLKQTQHRETTLPQAAQNAANLSRSLVQGTWSNAVQHDPDWNRDNNHHVLQYIGKGSCGHVYKIAQMATGIVYAMKQIAKPNSTRAESVEEQMKVLEKEISLMQVIHHPNIVQFVSYEETPQYVYIFMEYLKFGTLSAYIGKFVEEPVVQCMARQILSAIIYLHGRNITHRDIKPDNILVSARNPLTFKLADFGLSKEITGQNATLKTWCGTPVYMAPEIFPGYHSYLSENPPNPLSEYSDKPYSQSVDLWSLGAVVYHLLYGELPVRGDSYEEILDNIKWHPIGHEKSSKRRISKQAENFLSQTLALAESRATDAACAYHTWIFKQPDTDVANPVVLSKMTSNWSGGHRASHSRKLLSSKHHACADTLNLEDSRPLKRSKHESGNRTGSVRHALPGPNRPFASQIKKSSFDSSHLTRKDVDTAIQMPLETGCNITEIFSRSLVLRATGELREQQDQKGIPTEAEQNSQQQKNGASLAQLPPPCSPTIDSPSVSLPTVTGYQRLSLNYDIPPPSSDLSFGSQTSVYSPRKQTSFLPPTQPSSFVISSTNPQVQHLGQLTTLPSSIYKLTIPLTNGKTSFGRDPSCTFIHPNPLDARVPRLAFEIFWRHQNQQQQQQQQQQPGDSTPAINHAQQEQESSVPLIRTNTFHSIRVNGVLLKRGDQGRLCSGDIISVFENKVRLEEEKKGLKKKGTECLQFRCEVFRKFVVEKV